MAGQASGTIVDFVSLIHAARLGRRPQHCYGKSSYTSLTAFPRKECTPKTKIEFVLPDNFDVQACTEGAGSIHARHEQLQEPMPLLLRICRACTETAPLVHTYELSNALSGSTTTLGALLVCSSLEQAFRLTGSHNSISQAFKSHIMRLPQSTS